MLTSASFTPELVSVDRLRDAVDTLLSMQNPSGGYASYDPIRGSKMIEWLNPAEVFGTLNPPRRSQTSVLILTQGRLW